jgi:5-methylcytosine-specific restriction endonuclease McrA
VHHIIGLAVDPSLAFAFENLAPLCAACHNRIEKMEHDDHPTQLLFHQGGRGDQFSGPNKSHTHHAVFIF